MKLACRCGQVEGRIDPRRVSSRASCHCRDCRAFARWLDGGELLDVAGRFHVLILSAACAIGTAQAAESVARSATQPAVAYDAVLAQRTGADERGMRRYVLVILRTGPTPVNDPDARKAMFAGHMANIQRLAKEGRLVLAGPFGDTGGDWRGLFVFATADIEEAKALVATDPVIQQGEMVADYHSWYGSAATMLIGELHEKVARKAF